MSEECPARPLHLQDLAIAGFRGIQELSIRRLGRVTLLAGKNGVGKTTVLEAVRVFAGRGGYRTICDVLESRDEVLGWDSSQRPIPDLTALFHGRDSDESRIAIGPTAPDEQLIVRVVDLTERENLSLWLDEIGQLFPEAAENGSAFGLVVAFKGAHQLLPVVGVAQEHGEHTVFKEVFPALIRRKMARAFSDSTTRIRCQSLGPELMSNHRMANSWDSIVLKPEEDATVRALRLVVDKHVRRVAVVRSQREPPLPSSSARQARVIVQLEGVAERVPLKSLGDGAVRLFGVSLALATAQDGFLLIDEVENGIHHTLQKRFWRLILETAQANNVQVLATTHSFDCVRGFAEASSELDHIESALVRVDRRDEETWAVEYSEDDLRIAAEQTIEVR